MKLALNRPVKIVIIGAGGTGGNVIPHLYRIAFSSNRPCKVIICDGDIVERKNLIRQNFAECDIGENKAQVMAERYSEVFGIETEYIPDYIESEEELFVHIQSEPPSEPVNSYHCIDPMLLAKAFPSTSHGHDISASK